MDCSGLGQADFGHFVSRRLMNNRLRGQGNWLRMAALNRPAWTQPVACAALTTTPMERIAMHAMHSMDLAVGIGP